MRRLIQFLMLVCCLCYAMVTATAQGADDFDKLKSEFQQKAAAALGDDPVQTWGSLSLYSSRKLLSNAAALEFNKSDVSVAVTFPQQALSPQPPTIDLKMPHIIKNCSIFDCCDCGFFSPWCCVCDVTMAGPKAACELTKSVLDLAAGAHLGSIEFRDVTVQAVLDQTPLKVTISDDLSTASVTTTTGDLKVKGTIGGKADIHLETLVSVFTACFILKPVVLPPTEVEVTAKVPTFSSSIDSSSSDDGTDVRLSLQKTSLHLEFKNSIFLRALGNNPDLFITCSIPAGALTVAGIIDQVFGIDKSIDINPQSFPPKKIGQLSIEMPGRQVKTKLSPRANSLSLGVVEKTVQ